MNRKRLLFIFFSRKTLLAILQTTKSDISTLCNGKRNANSVNVIVLIVLPPKSIMKEQIEEMEEDSFHHFVKKRLRASAVGEVKYKLVLG